MPTGSAGRARTRSATRWMVKGGEIVEGHAEHDQREQHRRQQRRRPACAEPAEEGERIGEARSTEEDPAQQHDVEGDDDAEARAEAAASASA